MAVLVTIILLIIFSGMFYGRVLKEKYKEVTAVLSSISEKQMNVMHKHYDVVFLYPEIELVYFLNGSKYLGFIGTKQARSYRISELDDFGSLRSDDAYFWRNLKVGDEIKVKVNPKKPEVVYLSEMQSPDFKSEKYALLFAMIVFFFLALLFYYLFHFK